MKIQIVAPGNKMPRWAEESCGEYARRMPRDLVPRIQALPLAKKGKNQSPIKIKEQEGNKILNVIPAGSRVVALDLSGVSVSSEVLSKKMAEWRLAGQNISILIGGPEGLSSSCLQRADECWSLSAMTFPHPLVRVILMEQLYRAWTILGGHPYHK